MSEHFDGIILGTGHNSLVLQAYLSRSGLKVLSLDRASRPGGGLSTIENPRLPGICHNPHAFFHRGVTSMPWYADLELERHGVRYIEPELNVAMVLRDGRVLEWWTDFEKTVASFNQFSKRDAARLREWKVAFEPIVKSILIPEAQSPPLEPTRRRKRLERSSLGRKLLEVSALSPLEFVEREFESDVIRAGLLFFNGLREVDLRLKGFGHSIPALLAAPGKAQMCVGGSANLAKALVKDIDEHGGQVRCGVELESIFLEKGRAAGVELSSGERIKAQRFVASGLNPHQTFLKLLPRRAVPSEIRSRADAFQYNLLAPLFGLHVALTEPPRYAAAARYPELAQAFMVILGLERFEQFHQIVLAHEKGEFPPTVAWGACPTVFDPSQGADGRHSAFLWEKVPYALGGDSERWRTEKDGHARDLLRFWADYAPNLSDGVILDHFALSPFDTEQTLPNMRRGDLLVGAFSNDQVGYNRPFAGAGCYRAPTQGLYLCGGSTHPGGNITGLCGYNAAKVIAADCGAERWWAVPSLENSLP